MEWARAWSARASNQFLHKTAPRSTPRIFPLRILRPLPPPRPPRLPISQSLTRRMAVDGIGHNGGMDDGTMGMASPHNVPHGKEMMMMMRMTFFWGKGVEVLFTGWPGQALSMYLLALFFVFALAVTVEWLSASRLIKAARLSNRVSAALAQTGLHALRVGLAYLLMLAIMSFNGGVFLVAIAGHALGFLLFGSEAFNRAEAHDRRENLQKC